MKGEVLKLILGRFEKSWDSILDILGESLK